MLIEISTYDDILEKYFRVTKGLGLTEAGSKEEFFGFGAGDVMRMHFHKQGFGAGTYFRLRDGRASYGLGLETFALGFPIHFDWSWRTLFNKDWEDVLFSGTTGGGAAWRKPRFAVWIGYDF